MRRPSSRISPAGDAARRLEQADDRHAGERLAGARFADHAEHLARRDRERDVVDRDRACRAASETRRADASTSSSDAHRSFGLSASRSQSPSRLTDSTSITSATPGNTVIHHSPENRKSLPTRISVPSEGCVGGTPTPRNDSVASVMIAVAMWIVAMHQHRAHHVRQHVRSMIASGRRPMTRAACTYSLFFSTMRRAAHRARVLHPAGDADREDQHRDRDARRALRCGSATRATPSISSAIRIAGKRQLHVGDAHDERVEPAADVAGQQAERHAEHQREAAPRRGRRRARCARRT